MPTRPQKPAARQERACNVKNRGTERQPASSIFIHSFLPETLCRAMLPHSVPPPISAGTAPAATMDGALQDRTAAHRWDNECSLLANTCRLLESRLLRPLDSKGNHNLSCGLVEALAVLDAGSATHRRSLLVTPSLGGRVPRPVARVWGAALETISMIPPGYQSDCTETFVTEVVNRCAHAARDEFMAALHLDGDDMETLIDILQPEHRETDAPSSTELSSESPADSTRLPSPREVLSRSSTSEPEDVRMTRAQTQSHESPGSTSTSHRTRSSPDPQFVDPPELHTLSSSEFLTMHAQSACASARCSSSSAHAASTRISDGAVACASLNGTPGGAFHALPGVSGASGASSVSGVWAHDSRVLDSAAAIPSSETLPRQMTMTSQGISLREVTYEQLREAGVLRTKSGPKPRSDVILLANAIAHDRLLGNRRSVRAVAQATTNTFSGGDRTRAKQYAVLIEQLLMREAGFSPPSYAMLPPSPLTSPPSTPSLPKSSYTLLESYLALAKRRPVVVHASWALLLSSGWVPLMCQYLFQAWPVGLLGRYTYYVPLAPISGVALGLSISPDQEQVIQIAASGFVVLWLALSVICALVAVHYYAQRETYHLSYTFLWTAWSLLNFGSSLRLVQCIKRFRASSQPAKLLAACWALSRVLCTVAGLGTFGIGLALHLNDPRFSLRNDPYVPSAALTSAVFLAIGIGATPSWRERFAPTQLVSRYP